MSMRCQVLITPSPTHPYALFLFQVDGLAPQTQTRGRRWRRRSQPRRRRERQLRGRGARAQAAATAGSRSNDALFSADSRRRRPRRRQVQLEINYARRTHAVAGVHCDTVYKQSTIPGRGNDTATIIALTEKRYSRNVSDNANDAHVTSTERPRRPRRALQVTARSLSNYTRMKKWERISFKKIPSHRGMALFVFKMLLEEKYFPHPSSVRYNYITLFPFAARPMLARRERPRRGESGAGARPPPSCASRGLIEHFRSLQAYIATIVPFPGGPARVAPSAPESLMR
ncbi:hypothetical protein EVAR_6620_1 [Eumeta japonica]|uniref:Uncharacterized protein n=1 Tax=Eumeta variegata TaxID=151549 RepID=A0A4C1TK71_EUMVA|nr:hypothetical protein EVAR_6620_1 [Eumeta japonica]